MELHLLVTFSRLPCPTQDLSPENVCSGFSFSELSVLGKVPALQILSPGVDRPYGTFDEIRELRVLASWLLSLLSYSYLLHFHTNSCPPCFSLLHTPGSCPRFPRLQYLCAFAELSQKKLSLRLLFASRPCLYQSPQTPLTADTILPTLPSAPSQSGLFKSWELQLLPEQRVSKQTGLLGLHIEGFL